jgi:hypothetical protein
MKHDPRQACSRRGKPAARALLPLPVGLAGIILTGLVAAVSVQALWATERKHDP